MGEVEELGLLAERGGADRELALGGDAGGLIGGDADHAGLAPVGVVHRLVAGREGAAGVLADGDEGLAGEGAPQAAGDPGVAPEDREQILADELAGLVADVEQR